MRQKESFGWQLAAVDALPVIFFGVATVVLGMRLGSPVFSVGAFICVLVGLGKVLWKLLIALRDKDVQLLGAQLRYLMPVGFVLMALGLATTNREVLRQLLQGAVRLPSVACFAATLAGMCAMIFCARRFDRYDTRGNWIEQGINAVAQACFLLGVLFL